MITTIGKDIAITGTIHAEEPVLIAGTVRGDVHAANFDVTVENGGTVDGAVTGRTITVRGRSSGRLIARELVRVLERAVVRADVAAPKIALQEGALFTGSVSPGRTDAALIVAAYRGKGDPTAAAS